MFVCWVLLRVANSSDKPIFLESDYGSPPSGRLPGTPNRLPSPEGTPNTTLVGSLRREETTQKGKPSCFSRKDTSLAHERKKIKYRRQESNPLAQWCQVSANATRPPKLLRTTCFPSFKSCKHMHLYMILLNSSSFCAIHWQSSA